MAFSKKEAPNCVWCPYQKNCLYSYLDKSSQKEWKEMRVANRFKKGETIFHEGEKPPGLYVVCTGKAKIYKTSRMGEQLLIRMESPGDLLDHRSLLSQENYSGEAEAMEETVVSLIDTDKFIRFLKHHFDGCLALFKALSLDVRRGEEKARDIAYKPARVRLSDILLSIMRKSSSPKQPVVAGFKRKDLAEMAGLTLETTMRLLKNFEEIGLIRREGDQILVLNELKIRSIIGSVN